MIDALDCMNLLRAAEPVAEKRERFSSQLTWLSKVPFRARTGQLILPRLSDMSRARK